VDPVIGVYIALVSVSLLAAAFLVWALLERSSRKFWALHDQELKAQLNLDEAELELLRGPRPGVDANDPWRAV
jgi:hypothetical protein